MDAGIDYSQAGFLQADLSDGNDTHLFFHTDCSVYFFDIMGIGEVLYEKAGGAEYPDETGTGRAAFPGYGSGGKR